MFLTVKRSSPGPSRSVDNWKENFPHQVLNWNLFLMASPPTKTKMTFTARKSGVGVGEREKGEWERERRGTGRLAAMSSSSP